MTLQILAPRFDVMHDDFRVSHCQVPRATWSNQEWCHMIGLNSSTLMCHQPSKTSSSKIRPDTSARLRSSIGPRNLFGRQWTLVVRFAWALLVWAYSDGLDGRPAIWPTTRRILCNRRKRQLLLLSFTYTIPSVKVKFSSAYIRFRHVFVKGLRVSLT